MTTKATLKMAQDLLDRFFRDGEGKTNRQIDVYFTLEDMGVPREKAEEGLEYLTSRGLINMFGPDIAFLTDFGVAAISEEKDLGKLPKMVREFAAHPPQQQSMPAAPVQEAPAAPAAEPPPRAPTPVHKRPHTDRAMVSYTDQDGEQHAYELHWACTIGRVEGNTIHLNDQRASKKHAEIKFENGRFMLNDLGAANGTLVNGAYIDQHVLRHCDSILIGRTTILFECPEVIRPPRTPPGTEAQKIGAQPPAPQVIVPPIEVDRPARRTEPSSPPSGSMQAIKVVKGRPEPQAPKPQATPPPDLFDTVKPGGELPGPKIPPFPRRRVEEDPHDLFAQPARVFESGGSGSARSDDLFAADSRKHAPAEKDLFGAGEHTPRRKTGPTPVPAGGGGDLFGEAQPTPVQMRGQAPHAQSFGHAAPQSLFEEPNARGGNREASLFDEPEGHVEPRTVQASLQTPARGDEDDILDEFPLQPPENPDPVYAYDPLAPLPSNEPPPEDGLDATIMRPSAANFVTEGASPRAPDEEEPWNGPDEMTPADVLGGGAPVDVSVADEVLENQPIVDDEVPELSDEEFDAANEPTPVRGTPMPSPQSDDALSTVMMDQGDIFTPDELAARRSTTAPIDDEATSLGELPADLQAEVNAAEEETGALEQETLVGSSAQIAEEMAREELPAWGDEGGGMPLGSHPPFGGGSAQAARGAKPAPGRPRPGESVTRTGTVPQGQAGEELPEASVSLADMALPTAVAVEHERERLSDRVERPRDRGESAFHRTLRALRGHVERADLPDREALMDAIELLERHPYIRVALSLSEPER